MLLIILTVHIYFLVHNLGQLLGVPQATPGVVQKIGMFPHIFVHLLGPLLMFAYIN